MIANRTLEFSPSTISEAGGLAAAVSAALGGEPLRWFVSKADPAGLLVEATECVSDSLPGQPGDVTEPAASGRDVAVSLIPTGIGCAIGGFAGDAGPVTALLASTVDLLVTNPNAVNASDFIAADQRVIYTEGYTLDRFSAGKIALHVPRANRIGVIIERAPDQALATVINVINGVRAVHGIDIVDYVVTGECIGTRSVRHDSGAYVGQIERPDVLIEAGRQLIAKGATALAVTTNVQGLPVDDYASHFAGAHPNPVGGAEAVVSHLLTRALRVPAAHAPMLNFKECAVPGGVVDARGAAEFASASGLACVLIGLRRAPQLSPRPACTGSLPVSIADVTCVIAPATALGAFPVLCAAERGIPVIAVRENSTILDVTAAGLGLRGVIEVDTYLEAAGVIVALRQGLSLDTLRRPLFTFAAVPAAAVST
jgi:Protein of unknown function (DUF3326)